jgi:outer membrane receptor protein involved in Fe transport
VQGGRSESALTVGTSTGDLSISRWSNTGGGSVAYDNYNNAQGSERNRNQLGASGTYFLANLVGNHQIKAGADYETTDFPSYNFTTGTPTNPAFCPGNQGRVCGATFTFNGFRNNGSGVAGPTSPDTSIANRVPLTQTVSERLEQVDRSGRGMDFYIQDTWKPIPRLTLNAGVRFDRNDYYNNLDLNVIHFDKWQPRVSAAFDVLGDGKNVVRGNYGLFYVDAALTLARLFDTGIIAGTTRNYVWNTAQQAWVPRASNFQSGGFLITSALIDRPLSPTYDRDFSIAFERELFPGASVSASYINKKTFDIYEDSFNEDIGDFWLTNQPGKDVGYKDVLTKDYYGYLLEARFVRRRFQGQASYTYSKSRGSIDSSGGQYAGTDFDYPPDDFVNRYGFLGDDARHRIKVFAAYTIPWVEANLSVNYTYRTGLPYNVTTTGASGANTQFVEPRGTSRTPILQLVDLQLEKPFQLPFRQGLSVSVIGSVFNLTDSEQPTGIFGGVASPSTFRTPSAYQTPRRYEVGFRIDF